MIREFIYKYYIDPIRYGQAYNPVDTLTYAVILIIAIYGVYRWLRHAKIPVDGKFVMATIPFVVLGGVTRVVQDTGMIQSDFQYLLVTPLIYFVLFFFTGGVLVIAWYLQQRGFVKDFLLVYACTGIGSVVFVALILTAFGLSHHSIHVEVLFTILAMASVTALAVYGFMRYILKWVYVHDPLYETLIFGHMLDASATSYGIDIHPLHYVEQHVVGSQLIAWTGTAFSFFPLKLAVLFPGIYILERFRHEGSAELWHLVVLAMIVVGLAPGVRDMVRMMLYV